MPFGLKNAAQTFQRFMEQVLHGLDFCYVYIDDILVASAYPEEHQRHLRLIFEQLTHHGLIINPQKCVFGASCIHFLGHLVDSDGIHPLPSKVQAIVDFPQPQSRRQLRTFLSLINFYHCFIPGCARILDPLNSLLTSITAHLSWDNTSTQAFIGIKEALAEATLLVHPKPNALTNLTTDTSDFAVGAALQQYVNGQWQPISFFSKKMKPSEKRYSTFDRELLAVYLSIKHFRYFLEGRTFHVITDHKPLTFAFNASPDRHSPRQCRHLDYISQFTTDLRHIRGVDNSVADALSRIEANALSHNSTPVIDFHLMAKAQLTDPELQHLLANPQISSLQIIPHTLDTGSPLLFCDTSTGTPRPFVPEQLRKLVFTAFHSLTSWYSSYHTVNQCSICLAQYEQTYQSVDQISNLAFNANKLKSPDIPMLRFWHSNHLIPVLMWYTSIWLAHYPSLKTTNTCLPVLIDLLAGWRQSQSKTSPQKL